MDDIQNLVIRDRKWFKEYSDKEDYLGFYPYERAQHLYGQIKKLGKFEDDTNYLDKFREIITAVGNSLGFIRLIRSASLHTESKNIEYLPKKPDVGETFEEIASKSTLGDVSRVACK
jgi:WASH complex subunit 7